VELTLTITRAGVESHVTTRPRDLVAWERETGRGLGSMGDSPRFTDLALLAYMASTRGLTPRPDFDTWLDDLDAVQLAEVASGTPTRSAP
jgi:hypothetical protein